MSIASGEGVTPLVAEFRETGFAVIRGAIETATADELRSRLDAWFRPRPPRLAAPRQRLLPRIVERAPDIAELAANPRLTAMLDGVFGAPPQLVCSYGHEKPANTAAHTVLHSDVAHLPGVPHHLSTLMVKVMYALTPVTADSGATLVYPGSHRMPPAPPESGDGSPTGHQVFLDPSDVFLFHANLRHTATANSSGGPRLSIWFVYALPWMRVFPGYEYSDGFLTGLRPRLESEPHLRSLYGLNDPYATAPL
jgi:hypothetical protein